MKIFVFFILSYAFNGFSQTIEVNYYENLIPKSIREVNALPKNFQILYKSNFFNHTLISNGITSSYKNDVIRFISEEEITTTSKVSESGDTIKSVIKTSAFDGKIMDKLYYKDFKAKKIFIEQFYSEKIKIADSLPVLSWEILDEEPQTILGYSCKKAKVLDFGKEVYAWYTEDIPISDGPGKFVGLPGLILKIKSQSKEIIANKVNLIQEKIDIPKPDYSGLIYDYKKLKEKIEGKNK